MRLIFENERVLAVVAHPDDAELLCAGTLARAQEDHACVGICVLCRGDRGQPSERIENLTEVRHTEMVQAAELLGAELFVGGLGDGQLVDGPDERRMLLDVYRKFRPTLVLAHCQRDYHVDHRAGAALAEAASWLAASSGHLTELPPLDQPPALWWMDTVNATSFQPDFYVDVSDFVELKCRMLACHQSQLQRGSDRDFSPLEDQMLRQCRSRGGQAGVAAAEAFCWHHAWKRLRAW